MTREEAIKVVRNIYQTDAEKEALETLIPEMKESEDERIIKTLQEYVKNRNWNLGGPTQDEVLAWLERWKDQKSLNISAASEWLRKHVSIYMNSEYNEFHKCVEYDGSIDKERLINDFEEAMQKEQKPRINIDQLKSLMLQYLQEAANEKDDSDIEADTDKWARKILGYDFEQKPTVKEGDDETEVQKAYREGKNAGRKEVFDHPEYYGLQLRRMYDYETGERNPEWNEEDEKMFERFMHKLEVCDLLSNKESTWAKLRLKSLRPKKNISYGELPLVSVDYMEGLDTDFEKQVGAVVASAMNREHQFTSKYVKWTAQRLLECAKDKQNSEKEWSEEDKEWLSEVYFAIDHSMYSEDERRAMKKYIDSLRKNRKTEFDPKPGDKFLVRCKTEKKDNLWFDKGDERLAYTIQGKDGMMYVVYINKDGKGNAVSYQDKEKFLETFDILESK